MSDGGPGRWTEDPELMSHFTQERWGRVRRHLLRVGVPDADADDVTQVVFVALLAQAQGGRRLRLDARPATLPIALVGIARQRAWNYRRSRQRRAEVLHEDMAPFGDPYDQAQQREREERCAAALSRFGPTERAFLMLTEGLEMSVTEAREALSLSERKARQVQARVKQGIARVRSAFAPPRDLSEPCA